MKYKLIFYAYLLIVLIALLASCKKHPVKMCYKIESYVIKRIAPTRYEVTAVNQQKTIVYQTNQMPLIGAEVCF